MDKKICRKCNIEKDLSLFNKDRSKSDGFKNSCKDCQKEYNKDFYVRNRESICEYSNNYYKKICNDGDYKLARKEYMAGYINDNQEKLREYNKEYNLKNREKICEYKKVYNNLNKERIKEYKRDNRERIRNNAREYYHNVIKRDETLYLSYKIRNLIRISLKKKGYSKLSKTSDILGCSFEEFRLYMESKFEDWMNWDNHGEYNGEMDYGWDIDHIIPLSSGETLEDILKLNHYTNLQPLCSYVNRAIKRGNLNG
jgi:hypothetical protein